MQIIVAYDSSVAAASAGFKACINAVCQYYDTLFTNNVTLTFDVGYGEIRGQALRSTALGESSHTDYFDGYYSAVAALRNEDAPGSAILSNSPPTTSPLVIAQGQAKALGLYAGTGFGYDGYAGFSSTAKFLYDPTQTAAITTGTLDFVGVVEHEFSENMGRVSRLAGSEFSLMDLFRYSAPGVLQTGTGASSYFSLDDGVTSIAAWNNFVTGKSTEDLGDWANNGNDAFNAAGHSGVHNSLTSADLEVMAAIGWTLAPNANSLTIANAVPQLPAALAVADLVSGSAAYVTVADSAANISANLDSLQAAATSSQLAGITITDSAGAITLTSAQLTSDASALALLSGNFYWVIDETAGIRGITGAAGSGTVIELAGNASQYMLVSAGNGTGFTLASSSGTAQFSNIIALSFGGTLDFVAATPGGASAITSGNITELYAAVFGRAPDVSGLAFYEASLKANPTIGLTTYATYFLSSGEYTSTHNYAQDSAGEAKFVTDSYLNLLHRTASAGVVTFYTNIITPHLQNLTPGTAAYGLADLQAHALVLTYFSQSAEFLADVQITAAHPADFQHWLYLI